MTVELLLLIGCLGAAAVLLWLAFRPWRQERTERARLSRLIGGDDTASRASQVRPVSASRKLFMSAGLDLSPVLIMAVLIIIAGAFAVALAMMFGGNPWVALVAGAFAFWLCLSVIGEAGRIRLWGFESRFVDALDLTAGALNAGEEPAEAFEHAANSSEEPVRGELHQLVSRIRASVPIESAVQPLLERYDCESVRQFAQLLIAKWEVGGQLAPALRDITRSSRNGIRLRRQLHATISGAQMAGLIVAALPYVILLVYLFQRPETIAKIWALSYGPQLFFFAVILQMIGLVWLRRLLRTEL